MSQLAGLEYIAYAVATSPGWSHLLNEGHHRTFGHGGVTQVDVVGQDLPPVESPVELVAEQGDPKTFVLTVLSPNAAELTVTGGVEWVRCAVALVSLPETEHDH